MRADFNIDGEGVGLYPTALVGDRPQGVAGDCNSLAETHAWFDSRVAHHFTSHNSRKKPYLSVDLDFLAIVARRLCGAVVEEKLNSDRLQAVQRRDDIGQMGLGF